MKFLRRHLAWTLCIWLSCQFAAFAAPVVLAAAGMPVVDELCTCDGGDHETCPMHHPTSNTGCAMRSCAVPLDLALLSISGGAGILPHSVQVTMPIESRRLFTPEFRASDRQVAHDTPPPRL